MYGAGFDCKVRGAQEFWVCEMVCRAIGIVTKSLQVQ